MDVLGGKERTGVEESAENVLFTQQIPVRVKAPDRDELTSMLTTRLRLDRSAHHLALIFELTDEADPFFFYSLSVGEGDFHALKSEQRLLVDFQTFPSRLVDLLQNCLDAAGKNCDGGASGPRMLAVFTCTGNDGTFSVVESNQFKELTHIALKFRKGTDEAVKQYLASKLRFFKNENGELKERLRNVEETCTRTQREVEDLSARLRSSAEEKSRLEHTLTTSHQKDLADLRENHASAIADLQRIGGVERSELETRLRAQADAAGARADKAEKQNEELRHAKMLLESSEKNLTERFAQAEAQLVESQSTVKGLRDEQKQMELLKFQHEKSIAELRAQLEGLREQLNSKERMVANHVNLADQANSQRASTEDQLAMYKQQAQQLEEKFALSAKEIEKGNQIIRGLQSQLKQMKTKLRIKVTALAQQEKTLLELEKENEKGRYVAEEKELGLGMAKEKEEHLHLQAENLREKLAEAHKVIQSNQEVIEYLNRQLTERDLRGFTPAGLGGTGIMPGTAGSPAPWLHSISQGNRQPLREAPGTPEKYGLKPGRFDSSLSGLSTQTGSDLQDLLKSIGAGTSAGTGGAGKLISGTSSALFKVPTLEQGQATAGLSGVAEGQTTFSTLDFTKLTGTSPSLTGSGGPLLGNVAGSSAAPLVGPVAYRKPA
eukprot:gnl/MRDRNA2_/MRDRNA2_86276_c0_seq1.p1 gnl/MRDRNA2_/MRDRNA2_86276_c0~~gnl/MRDRNA2_/MRDRNA2_86276_c0_seq1.p1  ORF type:complete len:663 (+),score=169.74 gnl/MRDRNA2_/MRDRNA2_86276_c0_seq1:136-2124(+)